MLVLVINHQPHRTRTELRRKLVRCLACHPSTFSRVGASDKPGAVHTLIRPLTEPLQRLASARSGCRHRPVGPLGPLQVSLRTLREHLADELVASTSVRL